MSETGTCPKCGNELPENAPSGICPKCLMQAGFAGTSQTHPQSTTDSAATQYRPGAFVPPEPNSLAEYFPQLQIIELAGFGGMGAVYRARQPKLDRNVALKIIRPEAANDAAFAQRFNREAQALARLSHSHIVTIHDFGEVNISNRDGDSERTHKLYYFLMEYVDGTNLRQLIHAGNLQPEQAFLIVPQICEALQYAHDQGVVHRDIKPENILVDRNGKVKIADFGLAKLASDSSNDQPLTGTHQVMGTPNYMAPEQMQGTRAVDHRADIYSLGVIFYEMLTGQIPAGHFEPPSKKVSIDIRLDQVVLRSLSSEPARRYQNVSEVKTDVDSIVSDSHRMDATPTPPNTTDNQRAEPAADGNHDASKVIKSYLAGKIIIVATTVILLSTALAWYPSVHSFLGIAQDSDGPLSIGSVTMAELRFGLTTNADRLTPWNSALAFASKKNPSWFIEIPNAAIFVAAILIFGITLAERFTMFPQWFTKVCQFIFGTCGILQTGMVTCALTQGLDQLPVAPFLSFCSFGVIALTVVAHTAAQLIRYAITRDIKLQRQVAGIGLILTGVVVFIYAFAVLHLLLFHQIVTQEGTQETLDFVALLAITLSMQTAALVMAFGGRAFMKGSASKWVFAAGVLGQPIGLWVLWIQYKTTSPNSAKGNPDSLAS